ncbi:MAG: replication-associated recombination protein A [Planctomycetota bacterium]
MPPESWQPLPERMRPSEMAGLVGPLGLKDGVLASLLSMDPPPSLILWGPPGCGKTTVGRLLARDSQREFASFSAAQDGLKELRSILEEAQAARRLSGRGTVLFCDEIHRLNKAQQDAFLPHVENGLITLVGATTENPSFEVNQALLSRCRVLKIDPLGREDLVGILNRSLIQDELLRTSGIRPSPEALELIASLAEGDARRALLMLESLVPLGAVEVGVSEVGQRLGRQTSHSRTGETHYDLISCLHKSVRASDVQATVYYCVRMLEAGEDPRFIGRRLIRMAAEDIGLADPQALTLAVAAFQSFEILGSPEGHLPLVELAIYLSSAPKSNTAYVAQKAAQEEVEKTGSPSPPLHILNAPTALMRQMGYGRGYIYDHDAPQRFAGTDCLPEGVEKRLYYSPGEFGFEKEIAKRLEWWASLRARRSP